MGPRAESVCRRADAGRLGAAQRLQALTAAMSELDGAISDVAASEGGPKSERLRAEYAFTDRAAKSTAFQTMLAQVPRQEVEQAFELMARHAAPALDDTAAHEVAQRLSKHVDQIVKTRTAQSLKQLVSERLSAASHAYLSSAQEPNTVTALARLLEKSNSTALRESLGLSPAAAPTEENIAVALTEQGQRLQAEGEKIAEAGVNTLFRSLLLHDQMGPLLLQRAGIGPGSWAEQGLGLVKHQGEFDEKLIERVRLGSAVAAGVATGGMAWYLAAGVTAAMKAPDVLVAFHEVDSAATGARAQTARADAESAARAKANATALAAGAAVVTAGATAVGHHSLAKAGVEAAPGLEAVAHALVHGGSDLAL